MKNFITSLIVTILLLLTPAYSALYIKNGSILSVGGIDFTFPASSGVISTNTPFISSNQTITSGGLLTIPHGLGYAPNRIWLSLICVNATNGWQVGDEVFISLANSDTGATKITSVYRDSTNVYVRFASAASAFSLGSKTAGAPFGITNTNFNLRVYAQ